MAIIEQSYSSLNELHNIIQENLPGWLHAEQKDESYIPYRLETPDGLEYMDLLIHTNTSTSATIKVHMYSTKNNVNSMPNIVFAGSGSSEASSNNASGIVRIIVKEKTFAISLLSASYQVKVGAVISFVGDISDGNFYIGYSTSTSSNTNHGGFLYNMQNTNIDVCSRYNTRAGNTVLTPCCDYAHGNTTPMQGVFIPICIDESAPVILHNGSKKYYRMTPAPTTASVVGVPLYVEE